MGDAQGRLVFINFDEGWPFDDLIRRLALDLFSRGLTGAVEFRDLGGPRRTAQADAGSLIWGVRWPRLYGEDVESLLGDLRDDLGDVSSRQIERLWLVFVLPDPDGAGEGMRRALALSRRLKDIFENDTDLRSRVQRWAAFRAGAAEAGSAVAGSDRCQRWGRLFAELLHDRDFRGRQPFDYAVVVRPLPTGDQTEAAFTGQFILLRCLGDFIEAAHRGAKAPVAAGEGDRASSAAKLLADVRGRPCALHLPGQHPVLVAEKLAVLLNAYRRRAMVQAPTERPGPQAGRDRPAVLDRTTGPAVQDPGVEAILARIDAATAAVDQQVSIPPPEPEVWSKIRQGISFWSPGQEGRLRQSFHDDDKELVFWSRRSLNEVSALRAQRLEEVVRSRDQQVRQSIGALRLTNAGLTSEAAQRIEQMKAQVTDRRTRLLVRASAERATYAFSLVAVTEEQPAAPQVDARWGRLAIEMLPLYQEYGEAQQQVIAAFRDLVPRHYRWLPVMVALAGLVTIVAHAFGRANLSGQGDFHDLRVLLFWPPVLILPWVIAVLIGALAFLLTLWRRRARLHQRMGDLDGIRKRLVDRVHGMLVAALNYVILTSQLLWLDLLYHELDRRGAEEDLEAYEAALRRIEPGPERRRAIRVDEAEENEFFKRHVDTINRERVSRWLVRLLSRIDPPHDTQHCRIDVDLAGVDAGRNGAAARYAFASPLFVDRATIVLTRLAEPEPDDADEGRDER